MRDEVAMSAIEMLPLNKCSNRYEFGYWKMIFFSIIIGKKVHIEYYWNSNVEKIKNEREKDYEDH